MAIVTTEIQVANLALGLVGHKQPIGSFTDQTTEAEMAALYFDQTRDELLERWAWRFAMKRSVLALTTEERTGWGYCYAAPADMLKARQIFNGKREFGAGEQIPFSKELNDAASGHLILTDMQSAELFYTVRLRTVALWPALFVKAVAAQLAVYLAPSIPVKLEMVGSYEQRAERLFQAAAAHDANEAVRDQEADSEFIRERG